MVITQRLWGQCLSGCAHASAAPAIEPHCYPRVKNSTGINKVSFSCCLLPLQIMTLKGFLNGAYRQWITLTCHSRTSSVPPALSIHSGSSSGGRSCPRVLGTFAISWESLTMLWVAHGVGRSSPYTARTGLLWLSAAVNIHLLSEADWVFFFSGCSM